MWQLDPFLLFLGFTLALAFGKPDWMPNLPRKLHLLSQWLQSKNATLARISTWALCFAVAAFSYFFLWQVLFHSIPGLRDVLAVAVLYQAFSADDFFFRLRKALGGWRPRSEPQIEEMAAQLRIKVSSRDSQRSLSSQILQRAAESIANQLLAPQFWAIFLGPLGAFLFRLNHSFVEPQSPGSPPNRIHHVLLWLPARLVPLLSEVFRNFRGLKLIWREAIQVTGNHRWATAALAHELEIRLPAGEDPPVIWVNPEARHPTPGHVAESVNWYLKISLCALVLALLSAM